MCATDLLAIVVTLLLLLLLLLLLRCLCLVVILRGGVISTCEDGFPLAMLFAMLFMERVAHLSQIPCWYRRTYVCGKKKK